MIGRWSSKRVEIEDAEPMGFDAYDLRLGDIMRGERATLGKSLLDVQRELRIKASYISAIENAEPDVFDTPGFIAGYVRSYARYLNMDPDKAFASFCEESGFTVAHGMSAKASVVKKPLHDGQAKKRNDRDGFAGGAMPFAPESDGFFARVEPAAVGSVLVLVALISAIGFGGWSVLQEVQRVQVAPVDQTPVVLSDLDPLDGAFAPGEGSPVLAAAPRADALDRLYRPETLDTPVMVARDAPIATLDPGSVGVFSVPALGVPGGTVVASLDAGTVAATHSAAGVPLPQVSEGPRPDVQIVATGETWVRISAADGSHLYEAVMKKGDTYSVPALEDAPILRTGQSGAVYFVMNGQYFGPVGRRGSVTKNLGLDQATLVAAYEPVVLENDSRLATMVAELQSATTDADAEAGE